MSITLSIQGQNNGSPTWTLRLSFKTHKGLFRPFSILRLVDPNPGEFGYGWMGFGIYFRPR